MDILREISTDTDFDDIRLHYRLQGEPIFKAFGCTVIERKTNSGYAYVAFNPKTGAVDVLVRRKTFISANDERALRNMLNKLRTSTVADYGLFEVDRAFGEQMTLKQCKEILLMVFEELLPEYGFAVREEQIALAEEMLEAINGRKIMLAEAAVGTGKTLAYLTAAIIAKRGRINDFWNLSYYPHMHYAHMAHMPIVIATSSIALQKAIIADYIPKISEILLREGIIQTPITAVLRKGRGHYLCERKLRAHIPYETAEAKPGILGHFLKLLNSGINVDLSEFSSVFNYTKRKIAVPGECSKTCPHFSDCAYLDFKSEIQSRFIDFQVCNHQYLLADIIHRRDDKKPLIPNYQAIIFDEAHKLIDAARSMYGMEFSSSLIQEIKDGIDKLSFEEELEGIAIRRMAKKLIDANKKFFRKLAENAKYANSTNDESERLSAELSDELINSLVNIGDMASSLNVRLVYAKVSDKDRGYSRNTCNSLEKLVQQADLFAEQGKFIYWFEVANVNRFDNISLSQIFTSEMKLCATPKDLDEQLYNDIFKKGMPIVLTSGTLSTNGNFNHIRRQLGISRVGKYRISETSKLSPFDYENNTLLYLSENLPFPNNKDFEYIFALANEIEELLWASHGHAAILFTSYRAMDMVWEHLAERDLPFPMFRMDKGNSNAIDNFKASRNGVLFAVGSMWEGIDIPGDALSMLIIPKLPFAPPDPISEYEQTLYPDFNTYRNEVIIPEMEIKLKQGFGRLIRIVSDTGAIAILDSRAHKNGVYYKSVRKALPVVNETSNICDVEDFFHAVKDDDFFIEELL